MNTIYQKSKILKMQMLMTCCACMILLRNANDKSLLGRNIKRRTAGILKDISKIFNRLILSLLLIYFPNQKRIPSMYISLSATSLVQRILLYFKNCEQAKCYWYMGHYILENKVPFCLD